MYNVSFVFLLVSVMAVDKSNFLLPNNQRFVELDSSQAFNNLTYKEKLYAHYLSQVKLNILFVITFW